MRPFTHGFRYNKISYYTNMDPRKQIRQHLRNDLLLVISALLMILAVVWMPGNPDAAKRVYAQSQTTKLSKYDRMDLAIKQEWEMTHSPATGEIPRERLWSAYEQAQRSQNSRAAIPNVSWKERGPSNVAGRTRAILFDPNDPSHSAAFAGSVGGGLWKTTNVFAQHPDWQPINDLFPNLAITTITYEPDNPQNMYFGTGEGWFNSDAIRGDGIWKSTDGGNTWSQLASTTGHSFNFIQKLAVDSSGNLLAATRSRFCDGGGIWRSTDGGNTWSRVLAGNGPVCDGTAQFERAADIEVAANGDLYAAMGLNKQDGIYKSTDNGDTWTKLIGGGLPASGFERIELACAPSDANTVVAVLHDAGNNECYGIYLSSDGGSTWSSKAVPAGYDFDPGVDFTRGQAWYDLIVAFDPNDANRIFLGGIDLHSSEDAGSSWSQITQWYGGGGYQYMHADQHAIQFRGNSSDTVLFGNDGGLFLSTNASASTPTVASRNTNYNVTQYYASAIHPTSGKNHFLAGAQDNGSHRFNSVGPEKTVEVTGGDGAFCAIDQDDAEYQFTTYVYNRYFRSSDSGYSFDIIDFSDNGKFINPWDLDDETDIIYASYEAGQYLLWENVHSSSVSTDISAGFSSQVSAVTCDPNTANKVWFGTDDGNVYAVSDAHTLSPGVNNVADPSFPEAYVSSIAVSPADPTHVVVTFSNYDVNSVWETTDGGTTWQSIEGNLPDMPVRWALFNPNNTNEMMLATEVGVWSTDNLNGGSTEWAATNSGLANVRVDMLKYRESDNLVLAATHGRGLFSTDAFTTEKADFGVQEKVAYIGEPVQFYDDSYQASSWSWDFGDGGGAVAQNPQHTYNSAGKFTVSLEINGGAAGKTKTGYIHVLPDRGTPYATFDGGDFESNFDDFAANNREGPGFGRGNSPHTGKSGVINGNNAWVLAINDATYKPNTVAALHTPQYNFSAAGTYTMKFFTKYDTEADYDGFRVEYSIDQGNSWHLLGSMGAPYNTVGASSAFHMDPFYSGYKSSYALQTIDASALAGNPKVAFRFIFKSDRYVNEPGLAIDFFEIEAPVNLLPIDEVLAFTARPANDHALVEWEMASGEQPVKITLERSADGQRFDGIRTYAHSGQRAYSYQDYDIGSGTYYYRLRLQFSNGSHKYSDVEQATFRQTPTLSVAPNPASNYLRHQMDVEGQGTLSIYDISGELVYRQEADNQTVQVDVSAFPSGIYFSRLTLARGRHITTKWVKQ